MAGCAGNEPAAAAPAEITFTATQPAQQSSDAAEELPPPIRRPEAKILPAKPDSAQPYEPPTDSDGLEGVEGGAAVWSGSGAALPPPPAPTTLGTPAKLKNASMDCPFPPEADTEKVDYGLVRLVVRVDETGKPLRVMVVADPGHGFGRAARKCLLNQVYVPGRDEAGTAIVSDTRPIVVRFSR